MICPNCKAKCYIERREGGKPFEVYCRSCKTWYDQKSILIPFDPDVDKVETPYDLMIRPSILLFAMEMEEIMSKHDERKGDSWKDKYKTIPNVLYPEGY